MGTSEPSSRNSYEYDVFLSYNRAQKDWTRNLARRLRDEGFKVWFDEWCLRTGENWIDILEKGVEESRKIALVLSPEFLDAEWPIFEMNIGILNDPSARKAYIFPLIHTSCEVPKKLAFRQALDFSDTHSDPLRYEFRLAQLMADLDETRERPTDFELFCATWEDLPSDGVPPVGSLPTGSLMPFLPNPNFVGREDELKSLYERLKAGADVSLGQTAAATGLGGIGKTQLAVEFVYRYGRRFAGGVFWLDMSEPENIPNKIALCGAAMNLPNFEALSQTDQVAMVLREWSKQRLRLVVFDNVDEMGVVDKWRLAPGGTRALITTRIDSHDPGWLRLGIETISVYILPRKRSMELLCHGRREALNDPDQRETANAICDLLGDLPLAIHLAGAYLTRYKNAVSLEEYLDELQPQPVLTNPALIGFIDDPSPTKHLQNVAATFETSYRRLDQAEETDALAARLFHITSHFAPTSIPQELLIRLLKVDKLKVADAVNRLGELGLVQFGEEGHVVVHRLLREFAHDRPAEGQETAEAAEDVAKAVGGFANEINKSGLPARLRENVEHLRYAARESEERGSEQAGRLYNELGRHLLRIADFNGAKENHERALAIDEAVYGKEHPNMATPINDLGNVLYSLGDLEGAKENYLRALAIYEEEYGKEAPYVATAVSNLGLVLKGLGNLEGAKENYQRALAIGEAVHGKEHPQVAIFVNNLGSVLYDLGDLEGAKENFQRALAIDEAVYGKEHPNVASGVNNLGSVLKALGDLEGAKENYLRALAINEAVYGKDHPNVATVVNNLGSVLEALGDLEGAKENYLRALAIDEAVYGKEHPSVARDVNNLGGVLKALGDLEGAKESSQRALAIFEKFLGSEHPLTQTVRRNLQSLVDSGG